MIVWAALLWGELSLDQSTASACAQHLRVSSINYHLSSDSILINGTSWKGLAFLFLSWYYVQVPVTERVSRRKLWKKFPRKRLTASTRSDIIVKSPITASKNLENWTEPKTNVRVESEDLTESINFEKSKKQVSILKEPIMVLQNKIILESLILAQDERWRRA